MNSGFYDWYSFRKNAHFHENIQSDETFKP